MKARLYFLCVVCISLTMACNLATSLLPKATDSAETATTTEDVSFLPQETQVPIQEPTQGPEAVPTNEPSSQKPEGEGQPTDSKALNPAPPDQPVKLIFIHHSTGENWLNDENGGLGLALRDQNYFVSDTNYDWGPYVPELDGPIGSYTDIGHWWNWFLGPMRDQITDALYQESEQHAGYSRLETDPGGENEIIMFKSCFPNSQLMGNPDDPPISEENLLQGEGAGSDYHTVANAKAIYRDLLTYFASRPDKLFIVITAPPLYVNNTSPENAANARAFNRWLVESWLQDYPLKNVAVFDFYNVLTSNGGSIDQNDLDVEGGNHHRFRNDQIEYIPDQGDNTSAYATSDDDHPTATGGQKATGEFIPLLNIAYHNWKNQ